MYKDFLGRDLVVGDIIVYGGAGRQSSLHMAQITALKTTNRRGWHQGLPPAGTPLWNQRTVQPGANGQPTWYGTGPLPAVQVRRFSEFDGKWDWEGKHNIPNMDKVVKIDPATLPADLQQFLKNTP